jgi:hypothetical protein
LSRDLRLFQSLLLDNTVAFILRFCRVTCLSKHEHNHALRYRVVEGPTAGCHEHRWLLLLKEDEDPVILDDLVISRLSSVQFAERGPFDPALENSELLIY